MATVYEGKLRPIVQFSDGGSHILPDLIGPDRKGLRVYDFESTNRDQYWSEKGQLNTIGQKFFFVATIKWIALPKTSLSKLWKAQKDKEIIFTLNEDEPDIKFKCKVISLKYRHFEGIHGHRAAYSVDLSLKGSVLLDTPGYGTSDATEGYGTNYGEEAGWQSP